MIISLRSYQSYQTWSHDQIYKIIWVKKLYFIGDVIDRNYDIITLISKCLFSKGQSQFCWHIKNATKFVKTTYEDSKKLKELEIKY